MGSMVQLLECRSGNVSFEAPFHAVCSVLLPPRHPSSLR